MDFRHSARSLALQEQVRTFLDEHVYPAEREYERQVAANRAAGEPFRTPAVLGGLIQTARRQGLWNLFLPDERSGRGCRCWTTRPSRNCRGGPPARA